MMQRFRGILRIYPASPASDGAGVRLKRSIGTPGLDNIDPFLMLGQFDTETPMITSPGFPIIPTAGLKP